MESNANRSHELKKPILYVVCGPTATGKTARAIEIAKDIDGEIISADSRQVYRGMDIGTAKVTADEMDGIPHHLIDVAGPREDFSVADFKRLGRQAIDDIISRGKTPIICGGTGFYIDALVFDAQLPHVSPNKQLRAKLDKQSAEKLFAQLQDADPDRAETIDQHNKVRLIRALEIVEELGKVPKLDEGNNISTTPQSPPQRGGEASPYDIEWVYLDKEDGELRQSIHKRNIKRLDNGLIDEVQHLHQNGVSLQWLYNCGLEYRYVTLWLLDQENRCSDISIHLNERIPKSKDDLIEILDQKTWQYVTRQRVWFKKYVL